MALGVPQTQNKKPFFRRSLERIATKYLPMAAITALEAPLHEGLHYLTAKVLPGVGADGFKINQDIWYAKPLSWMTLGYIKAEDLPDNVPVQTMISHNGGLLGKLGTVVVSAVPEVATMTLGFYWLKKSIDNINTEGERMLSLTRAYCTMALTASTFGYMKSSILNPTKGSDYVGFTRAVLDLSPTPFLANAAPAVTIVGAGLMLGGSLLLTNWLDNRNKKADAIPKNYKFG